MKSNAAKLFTSLYIGLLIFLTGEILWRRLIWHQTPTQVDAEVVYALAALNVAVAAVLVTQVLRSRSPSDQL